MMRFMFGVLFTILFVVSATILGGFVFMVLWGWFIVPVFGLPTLGLAEAIGIALTVQFLTEGDTSEEIDKPYAEWMIDKVMLYSLRPVLVLGVGAIVKVCI